MGGSLIRKRALRDLELEVVAAIARGEPLRGVADTLCRAAERLISGARCVILWFEDGGRLALTGPSFSSAELAALTSGAADAAGAPVSAGIRELQLLSGGRSCWTRVIASDDAAARGTVAVFVEDERKMGRAHRELLDVCARLAELALSQHATGARLKETNRRLEIALNSMTQGVCLFDGSARLLFANPQYAEMYGVEPAAIQPGMHLKDVLALRIAAGSGPVTTAEQYLEWRDVIRMKDHGTRTVVELTSGRVIEVNHEPLPDRGWVATHEDITARQRAEARVAHMAKHDELTGLPNRVLFRERVEQALEFAGGKKRHAVLCLDLDRFKPVNDSLGHEAGDRLLRLVAQTLRDSVREVDTVTRLGGDEFAILAVGLDRPELAAELAGRVIRALSQDFELEQAVVNVGASVGIAMSPADGTTTEELVKSADIALYRAKAEERGTYRFFEPAMQARLQGRLQLEHELRQGLALEQFEVFYQPLIDLTRGKVCAFEALVRWHHPSRGLTSPAEFIGIAEETGLIVPLGAWVLNQACREAASWPGQVMVSVNLSPAQFKSRHLLGVVRQALAISGLPACRLELEITESVLLEDSVATLVTLRELGALGVRISMDDFGTGYSSLNYLRSFPFDKIKIDQSFIRDLSCRTEAVAIVRAIVGLGKSLNMLTTAEGVETEAQLECLRREGCNEVQGFLFGKARPASEIPKTLRWPALGQDGSDVSGMSGRGELAAFSPVG